VARVFRKGRDGIYFAWGYGPDGTRWTRSTGTRRKRDAERIALDLERDARDQADRAAHEAASLGWAMSALYATLRAGGKRASTIRNAEGKGGHVLRVLGVNRSLLDLEPPRGIALIAEYARTRVAEGAARSTIAIEVSILKMALRVAAREGRYRGDTRSLSVVELRGAHKPRKSWRTAEECRRLIAETPPQWREHVETYIGIGVRRMELYRLEARDLDLRGNRVHVRGTKTERADRWVPMTSRVREILERRAGERPTGRLFPEWTRAHLDLAPICERAEVPYTTVSDLRRTFASLMLSAGVSASVLKELMGHATTRQIDLVYGHASEEARQGAALAHPLGDGSRAEAERGRSGDTAGTKGTAHRPKKRARRHTS
jgi:integrase